MGLFQATRSNRVSAHRFQDADAGPDTEAMPAKGKRRAPRRCREEEPGFCRVGAIVADIFDLYARATEFHANASLGR